MPDGAGGSHALRDFLIVLLFSAVGSVIGSAARVGLKIFNTTELPPSDAAALLLWKRQQFWLLAAELSALPMFATLAAVLTVLLGHDWLIGLGLGMASGALGFPFLLHALQTLVRMRLNIKPGVAE